MQLSSLLLASKYPMMSSYFSFAYLAVFLPVAILIFSIIPQKWRHYFLLFASYGFFWLISGELLAYLILSTLSIHYFGIWLDRIQTKRDEQLKLTEKQGRKALKKLFSKKQRGVVFLAVVLHVGILLVIKYGAFFATNVNSLLSLLNLPITLEIPKFIMPAM